MFELVVIDNFGVIVLALRVYSSKKFNYVVYEMQDLASVFVQNRTSMEEPHKPATG